MHNDYPVCPGKVKVSKNMLSTYCKKIAEKYNISIGLVSKLIPILRDKKEYVLHYSGELMKGQKTILIIKTYMTLKLRCDQLRKVSAKLSSCSSWEDKF